MYTLCIFIYISYIQWTAWPEKHAQSTSQVVNICENSENDEVKNENKDTNTNTDKYSKCWTVIPFLHTFPATNANASTWITPCTNLFPLVNELLHKIPNIRTSLLSRLGPNTKVSF